MTRKSGIAGWLCALGLALAACQADPGWSMPSPNYSAFTEDVYPVLIRDCGFHACHGADERFFRVWGPGRRRLNPALSNAFSDATSDEIMATYKRSVAMLDSKNPGRSLFLRKPLATGAGGAGHLGADKFGRNVYRSIDDNGYLVLSRWVFATMQK
jgi:hypothetical protein